MTPIIITTTTPIAKTADSMENNHATKGRRHTNPPPIKITPKQPGNRLSSEVLSLLPAFNITYPIGMTIIAMIRPVNTSLPSGRPKSGASGS